MPEQHTCTFFPEKTEKTFQMYQFSYDLLMMINILLTNIK